MCKEEHLKLPIVRNLVLCIFLFSGSLSRAQEFPETVLSIPDNSFYAGMPIPIDLIMTNNSSRPVIVTDGFSIFGPYDVQILQDDRWQEIQRPFVDFYFPSYNINHETTIQAESSMRIRSYLTIRYKNFCPGKYKFKIQYGIASYQTEITIVSCTEEIILRELEKVHTKIFNNNQKENIPDDLKRLLAFTNPKAIPVILECFSFLYQYGPASYDKDFFFSLRAFNTLEGDLALIKNTPVGLEVNCSHWLEDRSKDRIIQLIEGSKNLTDESHKLIVDLLRKRLETMK